MINQKIYIDIFSATIFINTMFRVVYSIESEFDELSSYDGLDESSDDCELDGMSDMDESELDSYFASYVEDLNEVGSDIFHTYRGYERVDEPKAVRAARQHFSYLRASELRDECRTRGLRVSGRRDELIERLIQSC